MSGCHWDSRTGRRPNYTAQPVSSIQILDESFWRGGSGLIGSVLGLTLGRRSKVVWPLAFAAFAGTVVALLLAFFLAEPPPGYGPGF